MSSDHLHAPAPLHLSGADRGSYASVATKEAYGDSTHSLGSPLTGTSPRGARRAGGGRNWKRWLIVAAVIVLIIVIVAVAVPVAVSKSNKNRTNNAAKVSTTTSDPTSTGAPATSTSGPNPVLLATSGGDGSQVTTDTGAQFVYNNSMGGIWVSTPFNDSAYPQDDIPPLNKPFDYSTNRIRGVNLGGWLNTEPFIVPGLYEPYVGQAVDEWTLSQALDAVSPTAKQTAFENHYSTFITEIDFAQMAGAGLNYIRLPIAFWAIEVYPGEPFYEGGSWKYFLKAIAWARKYGIRINLDLHTCPGSQNGWNHSGRASNQVHCMKGSMGLANGQRMLNYIRTLTEFISQPQYSNVVTMFNPINEPQMNTGGIGATQAVWESFYVEAYQLIRGIGGYGTGNGPMISFFDGFLGNGQWTTFLPGADRVSIDTHLYVAFTTQQNQPFTGWTSLACSYGSDVRAAQTHFLATVGEWSLAVNDCGWGVNGLNATGAIGTRYEGTFPGTTDAPLGTCAPWVDHRTWSAETKAGFQQLAAGWMLGSWNYFFWTWKIGAMADGSIPNPMWSYSLGLQEGYMPPNARNLTNSCGNTVGPWQGTLPATATGGGVAPLPADVIASYAWPPVIASTGESLYTYTQTQVPITLAVSAPAPTGTETSTFDAGNGWANAADTVPFYTPVAGLAYPPAWSSAALAARSERQERSDVRPTPAPRPKRLL